MPTHALPASERKDPYVYIKASRLSFNARCKKASYPLYFRLSMKREILDVSYRLSNKHNGYITDIRPFFNPPL